MSPQSEHAEQQQAVLLVSPGSVAAAVAAVAVAVVLAAAAAVAALVAAVLAAALAVTVIAVAMLVVPALSLPRAQVIAAVVAAVVAAGEALAEAARLVLLAAVAATATEKAPSVPLVERRETWLGSTTSEHPPSPAALTPLPSTLRIRIGGRGGACIAGGGGGGGISGVGQLVGVPAIGRDSGGWRQGRCAAKRSHLMNTIIRPIRSTRRPKMLPMLLDPDHCTCRVLQ